MNFSSDIFRVPPPVATLSGDTMDHTKMVMACRFGWSAGPDTHSGSSTLSTQSASSQPTFTNTSAVFTTHRFAPCRGRLYHQLTCSHRIRTDIVEECGSNCLDPPGPVSNLPFFCHECLERESRRIWSQREAQYNELYPELSQMTKEQYEHWYTGYRQLEAQHAKDRRDYELEIESKTRPSNFSSVVETSKEDIDFAAELDSLSLSIVSTNDSSTNQPQLHPRRVSLPCDASEQLHWNLNSLTLGRGSCGVEYSATQPTNGAHTTTRVVDEEELWRKPRDHS
ncbi:uncharacterized protein BDR25DRAFT_306203 [Lindgomyces ingoldianus]|uniref:Uncharacterized protein n=1 Tax=Lindgomyces ingoldianus TaxID=673940 RepID=A0ACB6QIJ0_9PLEO|nr:uncharacterized protein BDR25DRAFT_306203 [Lindgomyces ingoldianus]KAF2466403.1 hypothetical protein BDR25DRAFT_306203 [Lindgomyces ingoldianus]